MNSDTAIIYRNALIFMYLEIQRVYYKMKHILQRVV